MTRRLQVLARLVWRWIVRWLTGRWATVLLPNRYDVMRRDLARRAAAYDAHDPSALHPLTPMRILLASRLAPSPWAWGVFEGHAFATAPYPGLPARSPWAHFKAGMTDAARGSGMRSMKQLGARLWKPEYTDRLGNVLVLTRSLKKARRD